MADSSISVDSKTGKATLGFVDDHGDVATAPDGLTVSWAVDNTAVLSLTPDAADPLSVDLAPLIVGTANLTATPSATPTAPDGTPFAPASAAITVIAGAAVGDALTIVS